MSVDLTTEKPAELGATNWAFELMLPEPAATEYEKVPLPPYVSRVVVELVAGAKLELGTVELDGAGILSLGVKPYLVIR